MSDQAANVVWLAIATVNFIIACWKTRAFFREPTLTLALISSSFAISAFVFIILSPWGTRAIVGKLLGTPIFATLPSFLGVIACFAITHVLTMLWTPPPARERYILRRQVTAWTLAYTGAGGAMTVTFLLADLPAQGNVIRFNVEHAGDPYIQGFLALFLGMLACGTLSTWWRARKTKLADERLQHVLNCFSTSMLLVFGYVVFNAPAVVCAAIGSHTLDGLMYIGQMFAAVGALFTSYGMSGAAANAWMRERRDVRVLKPLWRLVYGTRRQGLAHTGVRFALHRHVIEILDGMRDLSFYARPELADLVRSRADADLSHAQREAIATAVMLRDAATRMPAPAGQKSLESTSPPATGPVGFPGDDTAASEQRARLLDVAKALRHPLTHEALEHIGVHCQHREATQTTAP
ncbi:MAB_1171c family putative transporter [Streptomyces cinereoruber]